MTKRKTKPCESSLLHYALTLQPRFQGPAGPFRMSKRKTKLWKSFHFHYALTLQPRFQSSVGLFRVSKRRTGHGEAERGTTWRSVVRRDGESRTDTGWAARSEAAPGLPAQCWKYVADMLLIINLLYNSSAQNRCRTIKEMPHNQLDSRHVLTLRATSCHCVSRLVTVCHVLSLCVTT